MFGVYKSGTLLGGKNITGLTAACLWVIISGDVALEANQPNMEVFVNSILIWLFNLFLLLTCKKMNWGITLAIGTLGALLSLYKQYLIIFVLLLVIGHFITAKAKEVPASKTAFWQSAVIAGVCGFWWLATVFYFFITGRFMIFYKTVVVFCLSYANMDLSMKSAPMWKNLFLGLSPEKIIPNAAIFLIPLFIVALIGVIANAREIKRPWLMLAFLVLGVYLAIALPG
jgi:hypothetical protein